MLLKKSRIFRSRAVVALLFLLGLGRSSSADDPAGSPIPSDPVFHALRTDGTVASGRIRQMGPGGRVVLAEGSEETTITFDRLVKLSRESESPASPPEGSVVLFPGGDRLRALIGASNDTTLEVSPNILGDSPIPLPLDSPIALILAPPTDPAAMEALMEKARVEPRKSEVLWLANGDTMPGGLLGLSSQKVSFQREAGASDIDRSGVVGIGFDPKLARYPQPKGTSLSLTFLDGSRLGVTDCRIVQGKIVATTRFGQVIRPSLGDLCRVHVNGDVVSYLSDRPEPRSEFVGYLGPHRKAIGRDITLDGRALRVGGQPYDRGFQTQPRTLMAYRLTPGDRRFQATVGLDDRAGPLGSVVFKVFVDGKERVATPPMTARDAPKALDVDLAGGRILILGTEFGERGDVQDLADWIEARIIREAGEPR